MKYGIYAIHDLLTSFGPLFLEQSDDCALRNFNQLSLSDNVPVNDYDLFCLGEYDIKTGLIVSLPVPRLVCHGSSLLVKEVSRDASK